MKKKFIWITLSLVLLWSGVQYWPVAVHIRGLTPEEDFSIKMPRRDKKRLEYFFRDVCFLNAWAYTLMGSKPMSIHQYRKPWDAVRYLITHPELKEILQECFWPPGFRKICYLLNPEQLKIKLGWEALNKYARYFPNSRFVLYTYCYEEHEIVVLTLIDKIKLIKVVKDHLGDFQSALKNQSIEPEDLTDNAQLYTFLKTLNQDGMGEAFSGTLLGFGRDNAWLYHKYRETNLAEWPMVSMWADEQDAQLEQINAKILSFKPWDISDLFYPPFACDPLSEETKQLKQIYKNEKEKIIEYYKGKDVVEATLSLLNQK